MMEKGTYSMCIMLYYKLPARSKICDNLVRFKKSMKLDQLEPYFLGDYFDSKDMP